MPQPPAPPASSAAAEPRQPLAPAFLFPAMLAALLAVAPPPAAAQIPDEFTNLQVLPKEIPKPRLIGVMRSFATSLGVRCNHCHVGENAETLEGFDFASDSLEAKKTARGMMKMVEEINAKLLPAALGDADHEVRCVTCHRGLVEPETLRDRLLATVEADGVETAIGLYRKLRAEHYGDGAYDFSPKSLAGVVETLAREKGDLDSALAILRLSLEHDPAFAFSHFAASQLLAAKGETEAAIASLQRAIELDPENSWYAGQLVQLRSKLEESQPEEPPQD